MYTRINTSERIFLILLICSFLNLMSCGESDITTQTPEPPLEPTAVTFDASGLLGETLEFKLITSPRNINLSETFSGIVFAISDTSATFLSPDVADSIDLQLHASVPSDSIPIWIEEEDSISHYYMVNNLDTIGIIYTTDASNFPTVTYTRYGTDDTLASVKMLSSVSNGSDIAPVVAALIVLGASAAVCLVSMTIAALITDCEMVCHPREVDYVLVCVSWKWWGGFTCSYHCICK